MAKKRVALALNIYCPVCKKQNYAFTQVLFITGYMVKVEFTCCGKELESAEMPVLSLFPRDEKEKSH